MNPPGMNPQQRYRIWIVDTNDWQPNGWQDIPPDATALEAADENSMSIDDMTLFLEGFNQRMICERRDRWAVGVPVSLQYEGDLQPGQQFEGHAVLDSREPL